MVRVGFGGGSGSSFTAQNLSSDTELDTFDLAFVDASGGARTITMPASPSDGDAVQIVAVDTSGGNIIFAANSGQSLAGLPNLQNAGEGAVFRFRASDSTWYGTTADVLDRLYDTANDAVTSQLGTSSNRQDAYVGALDGQSQNSTIYWATEDNYPRWADVQNLIDAVPAGSTIMLENRRYDFDFLNDGGYVDLNKDDMTLCGMGWGSEIYLENNTTNTDEGAEILHVTGEDCTLRNFSIDGNHQNNSPGETGTVEDGHNINAFGRGLTVYNVKSVNATGDGIEITGDNQTIYGCLFRNCWEQCVHPNGASNFTVSTSILDGEVNFGVISTWSGSGNTTGPGTFANLIVRNGGQAGVRIEGGDGAVRGVSVENCKIVDNALSGVVVRDDFSEISISDNHILRNGEHGVFLRASQNNPRLVSITGNTIADNSNAGIVLQTLTLDTLRLCGNDIIDNNRANNGSQGIKCFDASVQEEYTIQNNIIRANSPAYSNSVFLNSGSSVTGGRFTDNIVRGGIFDASGTLVTTENFGAGGAVRTRFASQSPISLGWAATKTQLIKTSNGNVSLTLPDPTIDGGVGVPITVKKISSSNDVTINPFGTETIDGNSSVTLSTDNASRSFVTDGSNWYVTNSV